MARNTKSRNRTQSKSKSKKNSNSSTKLIIILVLIISLIFMASSRVGVLGIIVKNIYFNTFGLFSYVFISLGILFTISTISGIKNGDKIKRITFILAVSSIFIMSLINLSNYPNLNINQRIDLNLTLANNYSGIGVIGAIIASLLNIAIGYIGLYVALVFCFLFLIAVIMNLTLKELFQKFFAFVKKSILDIITKMDQSKRNNNIKKSRVTKQNKITKEINPKSPIKEKSDFKKTIDFGELSGQSNYTFPPLELLKNAEYFEDNDDSVLEKAKMIEDTLKNFSIDATVVQIDRGPTVTCYELEPKPGVKVSRIVNLADDLSLSLATSGIRIQAPIPGKSVVGIEVENDVKNSVMLKEILMSDNFVKEKSLMPIALGKDISGKCIVTSVDKMPHLLIAGATGSGKSVCINTIIMSILYKSNPNDVKLILIDPKVVELSIYNNIPHLAIPVVTDPKKASAALNWAVREMERRYQIFSENHVRDIKAYNKKNKNDELEKLPYIVIIIDELSDLMMVSANDVEDAICRLAQMARACGIHLIIATQRPTVDVITGTIKANVPSRISFAVSSQIDSRTILDQSGAEKLIGRGDMLFFPSSMSKPSRVQGAFISDEEVDNVVKFLINKNETDYKEEIIEDIDKSETIDIDDDDTDILFTDAVEIILNEESASISLLQRKLKIGYARAGRIIDQMEEKGIVGPSEGSKPRKILIPKDYLERRD
ncbi:MAG: DNA translocase FtsK [Finegoldia magna]|nr:DNA translocase FtsK [Finegoldia magna]